LPVRRALKAPELVAEHARIKAGGIRLFPSVYGPAIGSLHVLISPSLGPILSGRRSNDGRRGTDACMSRYGAPLSPDQWIMSVSCGTYTS
jgi:hypothetical protein